MWAARFGFFGRLISAGLNALMLDADVVLMADIYQGLKGPCLSPATMASPPAPLNPFPTHPNPPNPPQAPPNPLSTVTATQTLLAPGNRST